MDRAAGPGRNPVRTGAGRRPHAAAPARRSPRHREAGAGQFHSAAGPAGALRRRAAAAARRVAQAGRDESGIRMNLPNYETLGVASPEPHVLVVTLARPE